MSHLPISSIILLVYHHIASFQLYHQYTKKSTLPSSIIPAPFGVPHIYLLVMQWFLRDILHFVPQTRPYRRASTYPLPLCTMNHLYAISSHSLPSPHSCITQPHSSHLLYPLLSERHHSSIIPIPLGLFSLIISYL